MSSSDKHEPSQSKPVSRIQEIEKWSQSFASTIVFGVYMGDVYHEADRTSLSLYLCDIWTHEESLRFTTVEPTSIIICEVGFTPGGTLKEVKTIPVPDIVK